MTSPGRRFRPLAAPVRWPRDMLLIAVIGLLAFLPFLGQTRDLASREVRHALVAREMAESGDFLMPTLIGVTYPRKPPVLHAPIALLYRLCGEHTMALARFPSVIAAIVGAMALYGIGLSLDGRRTALVAAFGLLGAAGYSHMARVARPDMIYTAGILLSCFGFVRGLRRQPRREPRWIVLAGLGCAVATVSKGPLGLLFPLMFVGLMPLRRMDLRWPRTSEWMLFATVVLATAALWAVPAWLRDGGVYLQRVFAQADFDLDQDSGAHPVWWYLPCLAGGFLPLTLLLPLVAIDLRERRYSLATAMSVAMIVVLSFAAKKRVHYLLPVYPFLALAVGEAVHRLSERMAALRWTRALIALSLVGGPVYLGLIQPRLHPGEDPQFAFARKAVQRAGPQGRLLCYGSLAEPVAFLAAEGQVIQWGAAADLRRALDRAGDAAWVALPDEGITELTKATGIEARPQDVFTDEAADGKTTSRWHLYRMGPKPR